MWLGKRGRADGDSQRSGRDESGILTRRFPSQAPRSGCSATYRGLVRFKGFVLSPTSRPGTPSDTCTSIAVSIRMQRRGTGISREMPGFGRRSGLPLVLACDPGRVNRCWLQYLRPFPSIRASTVAGVHDGRGAWYVSKVLTRRRRTQSRHDVAAALSRMGRSRLCVRSTPLPRLHARSSPQRPGISARGVQDVVSRPFRGARPRAVGPSLVEKKPANRAVSAAAMAKGALSKGR
jgi:hypothetical protein